MIRNSSHVHNFLYLPAAILGTGIACLEVRLYKYMYLYVVSELLCSETNFVIFPCLLVPFILNIHLVLALMFLGFVENFNNLTCDVPF
jgi:hypothetical protein